MKTRDKWFLVLAGVGAAGVVGFILYANVQQQTCFATISASTTFPHGVPGNTVTVNVQQAGIPVTLYINGAVYSTVTSVGGGTAQFDVTYPAAGTYMVYATAVCGGITVTSSTLTLTIA